MTTSARICTGTTSQHRPCRAYAMEDERYCFRHSPEHREAAAEASRLGGQRRRKAATIGVVFDVSGLDTFEDIIRLLEVAMTDTLALENSVQRNRTLVYAAAVARYTLDSIRIERRLMALEAVLTRGMQRENS